MPVRSRPRSSQTVETLLQDYMLSCSHMRVMHSCMPPSIEPQCMCSMLSNKKRLCGASDPAESRPYQNESPFILLRKYKIVKSNQAKPNQVKSSQVKSSQSKSSQVKSSQGPFILLRKATEHSDGEGLKDTKRIGLSSVRGRARTSKTG